MFEHVRLTRPTAVLVGAALLLAAIVLGSNAPAAPAQSAPQTGPGPERNPQLLAMGDNTWLKLNPPREPADRNYSGCCLGESVLPQGTASKAPPRNALSAAPGPFQRVMWFFGGGHHSYKWNDVELYDIAANRWERVTEAEDWRQVKGAEGMGGGWGVPVLSGKLRPLGQHTYQQVCWLPERKRFFAVLTPGTWEFDPITREWECLGGLHAGKAAGKAGPLAAVEHKEIPFGSMKGYEVTVWQTRDGRKIVCKGARLSWQGPWETTDGKPVTDVGTFSPGFVTGGGLVMYDPVLKKPLCLEGGREGKRTLWAFDHEKMAWQEHMPTPIPPSVFNNQTYVSDRNTHLVMNKGQWWWVDTAKRTAASIVETPEALKECQSFTYDSANKVVLFLALRAAGGEGAQQVNEADVWSLDPATMKFARLPAGAGAPPARRGRWTDWNSFWYDAEHNVCLLLRRFPPETWAYRYRRSPAPASRPANPETR